ncbi:hypothetical protein GW17_00042144, partial [Ensete ventricosum]
IPRRRADAIATGSRGATWPVGEPGPSSRFWKVGERWTADPTRSESGSRGGTSTDGRDLLRQKPIGRTPALGSPRRPTPLRRLRRNLLWSVGYAAGCPLDTTLVSLLERSPLQSNNSRDVDFFCGIST